MGKCKQEWPYNFLLDLGTDADCGLVDKKFTDDQMDGLIYVLDVLSERQRVAVYLRYLENMEYEEIADIYEVSVPEIKSMIKDALSVLRKPRYSKYYRLGLRSVSKLKTCGKVINLNQWKEL